MRAARRRQGGITVIQVAMLMPTLIFMLMGVIQFSFYEFGGQVALSAAEQGLEAARVQGGSNGAGVATAQSVVSAQGGLLTSPSVSISRTTTTVTVSVSGTAMQLVPGITLQVTRSAAGPIEPLP